MADKVIVSSAITGSIHTPTMSPYLPFTPDEIARQAIEAAQAGAAILHLHARDPQNGRPTGDPDVYMQFLPKIKACANAVINITTGGSLYMDLDQRLAAALRAKPEMASFNMGSINFSIHRLARRYNNWKYDWEESFLTQTEGNIFRNTFVDMKRVVKELAEGCGTRFEFECYDVGQLYNLAYILDEKLVEPPLFIQTIFGILGWLGNRRGASELRSSHSGPIVRTSKLSLVHFGCGSSSDTACHDGRDYGWKRARGFGRQPFPE